MTTLVRYTRKFAHYLRHNRAVSALEYAILVGAIAVAMAAALNTFSSEIRSALTSIGSEVGGITGQNIQNPGGTN